MPNFVVSYGNYLNNLRRPKMDVTRDRIFATADKFYETFFTDKEKL